MPNQNNQNDILRMLSAKLGQSPDSIKESARSGNLDSLLGSMSPQQKEKVNALLSNPEATKKLMENPQVQALIKKLSSNG